MTVSAAVHHYLAVGVVIRQHCSDVAEKALFAVVNDTV